MTGPICQEKEERNHLPDDLNVTSTEKRHTRHSHGNGIRSDTAGWEKLQEAHPTDKAGSSASWQTSRSPPP